MTLYVTALWVKPWQVTAINSLIYKIVGRNFEYDEALKIIQFEEYTDDINFDEIKRYDVQKRIRSIESQKLNFRKGRINKGKSPRRHHGKSSRKKYGKIPKKILQKILQKNEDNRRNKKNKVFKMISNCFQILGGI